LQISTYRYEKLREIKTGYTQKKTMAIHIRVKLWKTKDKNLKKSLSKKDVFIFTEMTVRIRLIYFRKYGRQKIMEQYLEETFSKQHHHKNAILKC
jgi:hypothetical protein